LEKGFERVSRVISAFQKRQNRIRRWKRKTDPGRFDASWFMSSVIENKIKRDFRGVTDIVVHMEPMEEEGWKNKRQV
jgi:hypothetical protein